MVMALLLRGFLFGENKRIVQKNETLGGIAKKYGVSTTILQSYNGTKILISYLWEEVKIPSSTTGEISYTVKKGDSLGTIAARFGVKQIYWQKRTTFRDQTS